MTLVSKNNCEILINGRYRTWTALSKKSKVWVSGSADRKGNVLSGSQFAHDLCINDWSHDYLDSLNGCWAAIRERENQIELAVDRSRSIPILYFYDGNQLLISNMESELRSKIELALDTTNCLAFLLSTFVTGGNTLFENTFHVQPGEKVSFTRDKSGWKKESANYFHYFPPEAEHVTDEEASQRMLTAVSDSFATLKERMGLRRALLPISGGLDSRLIAFYLKKHSVQDVVCYTYGSPNNPQNKIAGAVAKDLGFEWIFIPYDRNIWAEAFESPEAGSYWDYACNGIASPHMQDFPALSSLSKKYNGLSEFILLPGHVGDAWASEFIVKDLQESYPHGPAKYHSDFFELRNSPMLSAVVYRYYNLWPTSKMDWQGGGFSAILDQITNQLEDLGKNSSDDPRFQFTEWVLRARTSQWITNACRSAEFFGAEFTLPLGDYRLIDLFRSLSVDQLYRRRLYSSTISDFLSRTEFEALNQIKIISGVRPTVAWKSMIINCLKALGVYRILDRYRRLYREDTSLNSDSWFTSGEAPELTRVLNALSRFNPARNLPVELYDVVRKFESKMTHTIECNGLFSAAMLCRYFQKKSEQEF